MLCEWNFAPGEFPDRCFHQLFEEQASRTPDAPAAASEGRQLTYRELNERANQLAHHLRELGLGPEKCAALYLERSLEVVVGLLAILKAGGAYVALDPAFPADRLAFMLEDAGPAVVLTQAGLRPQLPPTQAGVFSLDDDWTRLAASSTENPNSGVGPEHPVYVIYTSGSTGRPKGVVVEHRNLVNYVCGIVRRLGLPPGLRYATVSTFAADLGHTVVFPPLITGGALHVIGLDRISEPVPLAEYFARHAIDVLKIVPSHLSALLQASPAAMARQLIPRRFLVLGGEASDWGLISRVRQLAPDCRIFNHYGPTETTVGVLTNELSGYDPEERRATVPLGRPLPNSRVYVVSPQLEPVAVGVPGELLIGGAGVARGYLNRPDVTAERFIADPFSAQPGARLYRTGDRVRWLTEGKIEFLGRVDFQVKIRGYRIEPGEIEAVLNGCPGVRQSLVVPREDAPGEKRLVAYVLAADGGKPEEPALRERVGATLPEYMVPAAFVFLDAFPLTPNGKIDRRALPAPPAPEIGEAAPEFSGTPTEIQLAPLWRELLRTQRVGLKDNFFLLGGHSLLAMRLAGKVRDALGVNLSVRKVFEHPTLAAMARWIEGQRGAGGESELPPLRRVEGAKLPVSFAQERMLFLQASGAVTVSYNQPMAVRLRGVLDEGALRRSCVELLRRHEVWRTTYGLEGGAWFQRIWPEVSFELPVENLLAVAGAEREARLHERLTAETRLPFDLENGPVCRGRLFRLGPEEHVLLLVVHHVAVDEWAYELIHRDLAECYRAFRAGQTPALPALPCRYAEFAAWQRDWLDGAEGGRQLTYWRERLAGELPGLDLPLDFTPPAQPTDHGATERVMFRRDLATRLHDWSRAHQGTLFMTLLAAFQTLLHRYTGQDDIVVGTPIANRTLAGFHDLVGLFLNTVVIRTDLSGQPAFGEVLARVKQAVLDAQAHQDVPFERVVNAVRPPRHAGREPLFRTLFILNTEPAQQTLGDLTLEGCCVETGTAKFDLTLYFEEIRHGLAAALEYRTELFQPATMRRMLAHLEVLLEGLLAQPERSIAELPLLPEAERRQVLTEWNRTQADYPQEQCYQELFERQAAATPDAVAVVFEQATLTYGELNGRANQLAARLRALGVGPDVLVGICVERSLEMVVGLLAILKAGGAYVPLDPAFPQERLSFMVEDAAMPVLLTQRRVADRVGRHPAQVVWLDEFTWQPEPENLPRQGSPTSLAYVIYTSGSTGQPKGVEISHQALVNCLWHFHGSLEVRPNDAWLAVTTLSFDIAGLELWLPLLAGARVIIATRETAMDGRLLSQALIDQGATILQATPATWQVLLHSGWQGKADLQILCGGEAMPQELADRLAVLGARAWNVYGPTETTIWSTTKRLAPSQPVNIGGPLANTQIYVLDGRGQPRPIGVPGDLFIGGDSVARGYRNRPELTAERFVPDPFRAQHGARFYKTGDRAKWLADGSVDFLGRSDFQVKIRGFRIELGDIESALRAQPEVREAVVLVREDTPGDKRLAAYLVAQADTQPDATELRGRLAGKLPDYMVPNAFVWLAALPQTPNGKVDRKALPAPEPVVVSVAGGGAETHSLLEFRLAEIWERILGVSPVEREANFFDLGGHSLLAVRLVAEAEKLVGRRVPLATLFQAPTVAQMARALEDAGAIPGWSSLVPLQPRGTRPPFFFVHGWGGDVFHFVPLARALSPDQPVFGLQAVERNVGQPRFTRTEDMAAHYVKEIRAFQPQGPYYLGGYSLGAMIAYETARQMVEQGETVGLLAVIDGNPVNVPRSVFIHGRLRYLLHRVGHHTKRLFVGGPNGGRASYLTGRVRALRHVVTELFRAKAPAPIEMKEEVLLKLAEAEGDYYGWVTRFYHPEATRAPVLLFAAEEQTEDRYFRMTWTWRHLARGGMTVVPIKGAHLEVLQDDYLPAFAALFNEQLARAQAAAQRQ